MFSLDVPHADRPPTLRIPQPVSPRSFWELGVHGLSVLLPDKTEDDASPQDPMPVWEHRGLQLQGPSAAPLASFCVASLADRYPFPSVSLFQLCQFPPLRSPTPLLHLKPTPSRVKTKAEKMSQLLSHAPESLTQGVAPGAVPCAVPSCRCASCRCASGFLTAKPARVK